VSGSVFREWLHFTGLVKQSTGLVKRFMVATVRFPSPAR